MLLTQGKAGALTPVSHNKEPEEALIEVCGYKKEDGAVVAQIFQTKDGKLPKGWKDTPAKL